jgi:hypothetical protein
MRRRTAEALRQRHRRVQIEGLGRPDSVVSADIEALRAELEADPTSADTWNALGVLLLGARRPADADDAFCRAVALQPGHADAEANRRALGRESGESTAIESRDGAHRQNGAASFAAVCCIYDEPSWLPETIRGSYSACDRIFILLNDRPWRGPSRDQGDTERAIQGLADPEGKVRLVRGSWPTEAVERNVGLELLREAGFDYCVVLDADEIYDASELCAMMRVVETAPTVECWHVSWFTYWKSPLYRIEPPEAFKPAVFVKVGGPSFSHNRDVKAATHALISEKVGMCHHMSYARSDEAMLRKITSFSHADEIVPGWYEKVWLAWDARPELEELHPTHPPAYRHAVRQPLERLPPALRATILGQGLGERASL